MYHRLQVVQLKLRIKLFIVVSITFEYLNDCSQMIFSMRIDLLKLEP